MVKRAVVVAFLTFLLASPAFSQITAATASTDKTDYLVGDYINYTIQVKCDTGLTVYPPAIQDSLKNVTLIKTDKPLEVEKNGEVTATYQYILSCYDSAGITIPPIPIFYHAAGDTSLRYAPTNPVSFTVKTVAVNMKEGIKDVKSPIKIPFDWRWLLVWIIAALLAGGLAYYLYRRFRKRGGAEPVAQVVRISPYEAALKALDELDKNQLWQKGMIKEYHSGITDIIRRYFEERFSMPAMELPTSEAVELLKKHPESGPVLDVTYSFLSNADLVKFAKYTPLDSVNTEMMKQAYEIVRKTAPTEAGNGKEAESDV
jgi:hypothetical protein